MGAGGLGLRTRFAGGDLARWLLGGVGSWGGVHADRRTSSFAAGFLFPGRPTKFCRARRGLVNHSSAVRPIVDVGRSGRRPVGVLGRSAVDLEADAGGAPER